MTPEERAKAVARAFVDHFGLMPDDEKLLSDQILFEFRILLEEAARAAESYLGKWYENKVLCKDIAAAIRALKE